MTVDGSGCEGTAARHREWATAILLSGLVGSVVDWLIVLSQLTLSGGIRPFIPPFSLVTLMIGVIVSVPAIALTRRVRYGSAAAGVVALVGVILLAAATFSLGAALRSADILYTLIWFTPIVLVAIPTTTWVASRTGHVWRDSAIVVLASVNVLTILLMLSFGIPRV